MTDFKSWHKALEDVRRNRQGFYEELLKLEGKYDVWSGSSNPTDQHIASAFVWLAKETRIRETEDFATFEFFLGLFESQAKEIDTLKRAVSSLDINDSSLKTEIANIKSWTEKREEILRELEQSAEKRRKWFDENR